MSENLIKRSDAIKALEREKSDWNNDYNVPIDNCIKRLNKVKSADKGKDVVEVIRCQDCKYWVYNFNGCSRNPCTEPWYATDFCSYGEREDE